MQGHAPPAYTRKVLSRVNTSMKPSLILILFCMLAACKKDKTVDTAKAPDPEPVFVPYCEPGMASVQCDGKYRLETIDGEIGCVGYEYGLSLNDTITLTVNYKDSIAYFTNMRNQGQLRVFFYTDYFSSAFKNQTLMYKEWGSRDCKITNLMMHAYTGTDSMVWRSNCMYCHMGSPSRAHYLFKKIE